MHEVIHETAATRLMGDGQRYTTNRRSVIGVLADTNRPLTIPEILERAEGLAQSSAYRNLAILESASIVRRVVTSDEYAHYELAEDLTEHHHHVICSDCGVVNDIKMSPALEGALDSAVDDIQSETGFAIEHHRLDLVGTCPTCR